MVTHTCDSSAQEAEAKQSGIRGQPGLQESLSQNLKKKRKRKLRKSQIPTGIQKNFIQKKVSFNPKH